MYKILLSAFLLLVSYPGLASSSWGGPFNTEYFVAPEISSTTLIGFSYNWGINLDSIPAPGNVQCGTAECWVGFFPRTGLGGPVDGLCDAGGTCQPEGATIGLVAIKVKNFTPWEEAYRAYVQQRGSSGTVIRTYQFAKYNLNDVAWGYLCVGFASLPTKGRGIITVLAPNATCGRVAKPEIKCSFMLGSEINLGTVAVGQTIPDGRVSGSFSCVGGEATISASLITAQPVLGGQNVSLKMNGVPISRQPQVVGQGQDGQLLLEAHVNGTIDEPGVHQDSVVIMINFV